VLKVRGIKMGEGIPKIIVPLVGASYKELMEEIELIIELAPDMVEWRADKYVDIKDEEKVKNTLRQLNARLEGIPLLFTFRSIEEGGDAVLEEKVYAHLIQTAIESRNIDLVDIEYTFTKEKRNSLAQKAKDDGVFVVMSRHHFQTTPSEETITSTMSKMIEAGADIPKIAVMPNSIEDVVTLLQATNAIKKEYPHQPIITMAMGKYGLISRLAGEVFGSDATFGAGNETSAPGQIAVSDLRTVLKIIHQNS
jgi:3-dehydroquinate dehydratase-1